MQSKSPSHHWRMRGAYPRAKPSSDRPRTEPAFPINAPLSAKGQGAACARERLAVYARTWHDELRLCSEQQPLANTASISLSSCCCSPRCLLSPAPPAAPTSPAPPLRVLPAASQHIGGRGAPKPRCAGHLSHYVHPCFWLCFAGEMSVISVKRKQQQQQQTRP